MSRSCWDSSLQDLMLRPPPSTTRIDANDRETWRRAAHKLRGEAATLGFQRLASVLQRLESQAASPDQSVPGDLRDALTEAIAGCHLWLRRRTQEVPHDR
ncbi:Hpt domain-containing protein [Klebsiella pneumoniae subsp. pneumoniae]|nr:Hpt domain-containing protein [Klebsiella pneumoniae subsp. pneumoniae]